MLAACGEEPPSVAEALTDACDEAREALAAAPAPDDRQSQVAFLDTSEAAALAVGRVAADHADQGDDWTIADLAMQLQRFPSGGNAGDDVLSVAHEASAAIIRIDRFASVLQVPECGAATWRPADWHALVEGQGDRPADREFRRDLNRLCADTFPDPSLLDDGTPLLDALGAGAPARPASEGPSDDVQSRVISRLNTGGGGQSKVRQFLLWHFPRELPKIRPSENLERQYLALLAAFLELEAVVPKTMPRDPSPDVRERVDAALVNLEDAWEALRITC